MNFEEFKTEILENQYEPVRDHILDFATKFFTGNLELPENKKNIPDWVDKMEKSSDICLTNISTKFKLTTNSERTLELTYTINIRKSDIMYLLVTDLSNFSTLELVISEKKDADKMTERETVVSTNNKDHYFSFEEKYTEPAQLSEINDGALNTLIDFLQN